MATNISNLTSNNSSEKIMPSECILWLVVLTAESLAIVILNLITIIVFVKKRQLQRRSTYLVIHLAIVDLLAGAVCGPLQIEYEMAKCPCHLWDRNFDLNWSHHIKFVFQHLFSFTSLVNLAVISLERLHATFYPIRHRVVNEWVYRVMIIIIWSTSITREAVQIGITEITDHDSYELINNSLYLPFYSISVFVICVSYILIVIKVRFGQHPQFHVATKRERKLTGTSLLVALASLICFMPVIISILRGSTEDSINVGMVLLTMFLANSVINPVVYAIRMQEFRAGISQICCRASQPDNNPSRPATKTLRTA